MSTKALMWGVAAVVTGLAVGVVLAAGRGAHGGRGCPLGGAAFGHGGFGYGAFGFGPGERLRDLVDDLELSAAQKESIKGILRESHERLKPRLEEAHDAKRAVFEAALAPGADEAAVREASEAAGRVISELTLEMARTMGAVRATLTPEQRQELDRKMARHRERREERSGRFRELRRERFEEFLESL